MADTKTHILCCEKVYSLLSDGEIKEIIKKYYDAYLLGALGGDYYYFFKLGRAGDDWVYRFGDEFHKNINILMSLINEYSLKLPDDQKERLYAYTFGFITHHAVDNTIHPFVYYLCERYSISHKRAEVLLDMSLCEAMNKNILQIKLMKFPKAEIDLAQSLHSFIAVNLSRTIPPDGLIEKSLKNMCKVMELSNRSYLRGLASVLFGSDDVSTDIFYKRSGTEQTIDIMNKAGEMWASPQAPENIYTLSYLELFDYAVSDSLKRIPKMYALMKRGQKGTDTTRIFKSLSF